MTTELSTDPGELRDLAATNPELRERLRRRGRDHDAVRPEAEVDVLGPGPLRLTRLGEQLGQHLAARQRGDGQRRDEARRGGGHHRLHFGARLDEAAREVGVAVDVADEYKIGAISYPCPNVRISLTGPLSDAQLEQGLAALADLLSSPSLNFDSYE